MRNKVVIVGKDHHNALGIVESLGWQGVLSYLVIYTNRKRSYVSHSKYIKQYWCCENEKEIIATLLENFQDLENKAIAFVCDDESAIILDRNHKLLDSRFFLLTTTPAGHLLEWTRKEKMSKLAKDIGLTVPETWVSNQNQVPEGVHYPVITKAHSSIEGGKDNIHICNNRKELENVLSRNHCETMVLQQYILKEYEFQLLGFSLNCGETVIIPGRTHIDRPHGIDNTFFLSFDKCEKELEGIIEKAVEFVKRTKYTGPFSIEFLKGKNGIAYFTEMNFRNDGNAICVTKSGTNIPYILYLYFSGGDYKGYIESSRVEKVYLVPELYYFTRMLHKEIGFGEWLTNMRKANCYTTFFKNDPAPFLWFLYLAVCKRLFNN